MGDDYRVDYHYCGAVVPWLSEAQEKHFLAEGLVEKIEGGPVQSEPAPTAPAGAPGAPLKTAPLEEWVKFAVSKGANAEEAAKQTKPDLIELYGS